MTEQKIDDWEYYADDCEDEDDHDWCGDCGECEDCLDIAMDECGRMRDGICTKAGTEYCDWDCPFSGEDMDEIFEDAEEEGSDDE